MYSSSEKVVRKSILAELSFWIIVFAASIPVFPFILISIRSSVHKLYDESVDLNSKFIEIINSFTFCDISYDYNINVNPHKKIKYAFISILQEALTNIINHSDATEARVILNEHPGLYQLIIRDNGKVKKYDINNGLGIRNMVDRVRSLNGNINITTTNGFEIFIAVPREGHDNESIDS